MRTGVIDSSTLRFSRTRVYRKAPTKLCFRVLRKLCEDNSYRSTASFQSGLTRVCIKRRSSSPIGRNRERLGNMICLHVPPEMIGVDGQALTKVKAMRLLSLNARIQVYLSTSVSSCFRLEPIDQCFSEALRAISFIGI